MFAKFVEYWNKYGFEIAIGMALLVILIGTFFRIGKRGTWTPKSVLEQSFNQRDSPSPSTPFRGDNSPPRGDSKGETECRRVMQLIFNKPFPKARPDFLNNPVTGGNFNLELDCYNPELKIAVEYNGVQHYKYTPYFHKNYEAFTNQKYRDYMKRTMCRENRITLIEVPYTVKLDEIENFLRKRVKGG